MADTERLLAALSDFARTLSGRFAIADVLNQLTDHITEVLDVDGAGVSLLDESNQLRFVTASSAILIDAEQTQERLQQGPCVDAVLTGDIVKSVDLHREARWPELRPVLTASSFRAAAGIPLRSEDRPLGSLNLYDSKRRVWSDDDLRSATVLGDMAVGYVINASQLERAERTREQLQEALDSRIVIEQAKGMIANANGISVDDAFQLLRRYARTQRKPLRAVASDVVEGALKVT